MTLPVAITDHVAQALDTLLSQFSEPNGVRVRALVTIFNDEIQTMEDWQQDVAAQLNDIDLAIGAQLDRYGGYVGEVRNTLADDDFRRVIKARGLANQSETDIETIIAIASLVTQGAIKIVISGRAYFRLTYTLTSPLSTLLRQAIVRLVVLAKPVGVSCTIIEANDAAGDNFTYDIGPGYDVGHYASIQGGA